MMHARLKEPKQIFDFTAEDRRREEHAMMENICRRIDTLCTLIETSILQSAVPGESGQA